MKMGNVNITWFHSYYVVRGCAKSKGGFSVTGQISKEALDLVAALRPFTNERGRNLIDTMIGLFEEDLAKVGGLEISSLAEKARTVLTSTVETAMSLFLILVIVWLAQYATTAAPGSTPQQPG